MTQATAATRVVIADDHDLVRSGIKALLHRIGGVEVVGEAGDGAELLAAVDALLPDLVVTDISMPSMDGIAAIAQLHARHPGVRLVILSEFDALHLVRRTFQLGARAYLSKSAIAEELESAVRGVMAGGTYHSQAIARRMEKLAVDELTDRQVDILRLIAHGKPTREIAAELGLSAKTVDTHRMRIMERLRLHDVASLTRYAIRLGLLTP